MNCLNRLYTDHGYAIGWAVISFFVIALAGIVSAVAFLVATIDDEDLYGGNVITVEGVGEVDATPDVAIFSFSVIEEADTTEAAQDLASRKTNSAIAYLTDNGVEEKDIKTTGYNAYPKYEWIQEVCQFDRACPPGKNELIGYEVSQSISVKVRDTETAGEILSGIGAIGVQNISGLEFVIDDDASLKEEAQKIAIQDAKERAKRLTDELGVKLGDVVSFYENGGYPEPYMMERSVMSSDAGFGGGAVAPKLPTGENTVTSRVSVTYEID